jgi:hypothetical protein
MTSTKAKDTATPARRFGSEVAVEQLTGRSRRTLQKDRIFGKGFPFYRVQGQVLYDLDEVESRIRAGRVETNA